MFINFGKIPVFISVYGCFRELKSHFSILKNSSNWLKIKVLSNSDTNEFKYFLFVVCIFMLIRYMNYLEVVKIQTFYVNGTDRLKMALLCGFYNVNIAGYNLYFWNRYKLSYILTCFCICLWVLHLLKF